MANAKPSTEQPRTRRTTLLTSRQLPRAFLFLWPLAIAARQAVTTVRPKQGTASQSTHLLPLRITWPWAARISATPIPAPTSAIGTPPTHLRLVQQFPTFPKFRGTILVL